jgi:hypothetical protein
MAAQKGTRKGVRVLEPVAACSEEMFTGHVIAVFYV